MRAPARPRLVCFVALAGFLAAPAVTPSASLHVEGVETEVQLDPNFQAAYVTARLRLRHEGLEPLDQVELDFPAELGPRIEVRTVWDRRGELEWQFPWVKEKFPRTLRVALRAPLNPGEKFILGVSYAIDTLKLPANPPVIVTPRAARLSTTGWYPLPAAPDPHPPNALRLTLRLPKEWQLTSDAKVKRLRNGTKLATYELLLKPVEAGRLLLEAEAAPDSQGRRQ